MEKTYKNISYLFAAALLFVIFAFTRTYFSLFPAFIGTPLLIHFHVITIMLWFAMLIAQPILIRTKQVEWHRKIGKASYFLVPLMVLFFLLVVNQEQTREKNIGVFAANLIGVPLFVVYYGLAIYYRKKPAYHFRFIILTLIPFIGPAFARLKLSSLELEFGIFFGLLILERFTRKVYKPYLIGLGVYLFIFAVVAYLFLLNKALLESLWNVFFK